MPLMMISRATQCRIVLGLALALGALSAEATPTPCQQIVAACKSSGFVVGDVKQGFGLWADCINPIVRGTTPPANTDKPLPVISPDVVAACKQQDPAFGQHRRAAPPPPPPAT